MAASVFLDITSDQHCGQSQQRWRLNSKQLPWTIFHLVTGETIATAAASVSTPLLLCHKQQCCSTWARCRSVVHQQVQQQQQQQQLMAEVAAADVFWVTGSVPNACCLTAGFEKHWGINHCCGWRLLSTAVSCLAVFWLFSLSLRLWHCSY
jgi:hypothetical protein